jgi:uncharacterized protein with von Willebrand factor type A (vWA) domain
VSGLGNEPADPIELGHFNERHSESVISDETAVLVISDALAAADKPAAQLVAAELLCRNALRLDPCQSLHWPAAVDGCWVPLLVPKAKVLVVEALVRMT